MKPVANIVQLGTGYVVTVMGTPPAEQYCADTTAVAAFLIAQLAPGSTFTPAPVTPPPPAQS